MIDNIEEAVETANHKEAYELAALKRNESNLARAYLELREANARLEERIMEVEAYGREYIERTDPLIACDAASVELSEGRCGTCRYCLSDHLEALQQENADLRAAARAILDDEMSDCQQEPC